MSPLNDGFYESSEDAEPMNSRFYLSRFGEVQPQQLLRVKRGKMRTKGSRKNRTQVGDADQAKLCPKCFPFA